MNKPAKSIRSMILENAYIIYFNSGADAVSFQACLKESRWQILKNHSKFRDSLIESASDPSYTPSQEEELYLKTIYEQGR